MKLQCTSQSGYALLLFVLVILGMGGMGLAGYVEISRKDVEQQRFLHNKRVLEEAKQALLMYAYRYPQFNNEGPGRLPCPDIDGDFEGDTDCTLVGRLPWNHTNLDFYDIRDAYNQQLWYALSDSFDNTGGGGEINSDTPGTITIFGQRGDLMYDGAANGVVAVIFAPGEPLAGQDRNANPDDAAHFLDAFGGYDNSNFVDEESDDLSDGFRLGPVYDIAQNTIVMNDQMILITADEILEMAERAVLSTYRDSINDYFARFNHYPWLYNYDVDEVGGTAPTLDDYPVNVVFDTERDTRLVGRPPPYNIPTPRVGRVPSFYGAQFTEDGSLSAATELILDLDADFPLNPAAVTFNETFPAAATGTLLPLDAAPVNYTFNAAAAANMLDGLSFVDVDPNTFGTGGHGQIVMESSAAETVGSAVQYYWDEEPIAIGNGWILCGDDGDGIPEVSDCNRDAGGINDPGGPNITASQVLRVDIGFSVLNPTTTVDLDYDPPPTITYQGADNTRHARIKGDFLGADVDVSTFPVVISYQLDEHYFLSFDIQRSGFLDPTGQVQVNSFALETRYYPELPRWVFNNDWHESAMLAYPDDYAPDAATAVPFPAIPPCTTGVDCLSLGSTSLPVNNKVAIMMLAGDHDWIDEGLDGLSNDIGDVFDAGNDDLDDIFDADVAGGNDMFMIISEL